MRESRANHGLSLDFPYTCVRHVFVAESDEEAERKGTEYVDYYMKSTAQFRPIGDHERGQMVFGGPETCVEKIQELNEVAGINNLICWMNFGGLPIDMVKASMNLFVEEVIPKCREFGAIQQAAE